MSFRYDVTVMIPLRIEAINTKAFNCEYQMNYDVSVMYIFII